MVLDEHDATARAIAIAIVSERMAIKIPLVLIRVIREIRGHGLHGLHGRGSIRMRFVPHRNSIPA